MDSDTSSVSSNSEPEHELSVFERIGEHIDSFSSCDVAYKVQRETKLTRALDNLACSPFVSFKSRVGTATFKLLVKGEDVGTWMNPDVGVLQKHATPSPFGRGAETVLDPTYRNGTELKADELAFSLQGDKKSQYKQFVSKVEDELQTSMFVGKNVSLKLYKLAIYGEGGHFDWHRDSTHSDAHHGTVLVALNTEWEGGELMLRHQGVETIVNMHPTKHPRKSGEELHPVVVAFYTDTEHKVMPVTKGTRLVLQYDVEVVEQPPEDGITPPSYTPMERAFLRHQHIESHINTYPNLDQKLVQAVVDEIRDLHKGGTTVVAFPLTHLYRKASVKKKYLKGTDSALSDALENHFNVVLHPVLIRAIEDGNDCDCLEEFFAHKYQSSENEEPSRAKRQWGRVFENASFYLPRVSAILQLSLPNGAHLGNEAQIGGEARYYGAGMFVEPKIEE
ncbi:uncharacterized protein F5891DRAFT_1047019 [Suillus fuscotomentosus]|uniref:Fe2OG dioxygenase domain-containing protein n=1 Tax=Suillus fuscotomentosus TaxID=1912939 RepID=A0AAD4E3N7_9AGAM|nr:uncharacterized protein F5891DRAFT_1047019 [Suillus fuscotomentosus]KAG1897693.1 hypothetical protein F5891DRAFT_1047019 [Suillus fuscotomentosus]